MTSADRMNLHVLLLQTLRAKGELGRTEDALHNDARMGAYDIGLQELQAELRQLEAKKWIVPLTLDLGPRRWTIAPLGERALTASGL